MISVNDVTKAYTGALPFGEGAERRQDRKLDEQYALRGISFQCKSGEAAGLLGPNGAGKTTTLRILASSLKPTSGEVHYGELNIVNHPLEARSRVGVLACHTPLYHRLSVRENLEYWGQLYGLKGKTLQQRVDELIERFGLSGFISQRAEELSTGMTQRAAFARAVIHSPDVFILDEPTTGLDVLASAEILDFISDLKKDGVAVVFSTHHFHEVEAVCDKAVVIIGGRVEFSGTVGELKARGEEGGLHAAFMEMVRRRQQ